MRRAWGLGAVVLVVVLAPAGAAPAVARADVAAVFRDSAAPIACVEQAAPGPAAGQRFCSGTPSTVPSWDGTPIDVAVTLPAARADGPDGGYPALVVLGGWTDGKETPVAFDGSDTQRWARRGYAVVSLTPRGFGASCGPETTDPAPCAHGYTHLGHRAYEVRDVQHLLGLLVDDGVVDPQRIGVWGSSYGGATALQLGALRDRVELPGKTYAPWVSPGAGTPLRVAATLAEAAYTDLPATLAPNGSTLDYLAFSPYRGPLGDRRFGIEKQDWYEGLVSYGETKGVYAAEGSDSSADMLGWLRFAQTGGPYDVPAAQAWVDELSGAHSVVSAPHDRAPAPALLAGGLNDDLIGVAEAIRYYNIVRALHPDAPIELFALDFGHQPRARPVQRDDLARLRAAEDAWADHYVAGRGAAPAGAHGGVEVLTSVCPLDAPGEPLRAPTWAALAPGELRLVDDAPQAVAAPGGAAAQPFASGTTVCTQAPDVAEAGTARYALGPLPAGGALLAGAPTVVAQLTTTGANDQLVARLYDRDPVAGSRRLVARGVLRPAEGDPAGPESSSEVFQLGVQAMRVAAGHELVLELRAADPPFLRPASVAAPQEPIRVERLELRVPVREAPGALGGLVLAPAERVLPAGGVLAHDLAVPADPPLVGEPPSSPERPSSPEPPLPAADPPPADAAPGPGPLPPPSPPADGLRSTPSAAAASAERLLGRAGRSVRLACSATRRCRVTLDTARGARVAVLHGRTLRATAVVARRHRAAWLRVRGSLRPGRYTVRVTTLAGRRHHGLALRRRG